MSPVGLLTALALALPSPILAVWGSQRKAGPRRQGGPGGCYAHLPIAAGNDLMWGRLSLPRVEENTRDQFVISNISLVNIVVRNKLASWRRYLATSS